MLTNYLDWSDRSYERYESGEATDKFADIDYVMDDTTVEIHLRRNTSKRRDFTIYLPEELLRKLYEDLKGRFEE